MNDLINKVFVENGICFYPVPMPTFKNTYIAGKRKNVYRNRDLYKIEMDNKGVKKMGKHTYNKKNCDKKIIELYTEYYNRLK